MNVNYMLEEDHPRQLLIEDELLNKYKIQHIHLKKKEFIFQKKKEREILIK